MPALNELLAPFGIAFGDAILEGQVPLEPDKPYYASGANIVRFPAGGHLHGWQLADKATEGTLTHLPTHLVTLVSCLYAASFRAALCVGDRMVAGFTVTV